MEGKASFPLKSIGHSVGRYYIVYTVTVFFAYSGDLQLLLKPPSQNIMTVSIDSGRSKYKAFLRADLGGITSTWYGQITSGGVYGQIGDWYDRAKQHQK